MTPPPARLTALRARAKGVIARLVTLVVSLLVAGAIVEGAFRVADWRESARTYSHGKGAYWLRDDRWGWRLTQGHYELGTSEFQVEGDINTLSMNDDPFDPAADASRTRVLALGDSHTFAWGVSMRDAWPKVLERGLDAAHPGRGFRVYNAAVAGYNMHQYLLRLVDQGPIVKPDYVVVGVSYATDLYDLIPPDHGDGHWAYGWPDQPRDYFDLDAAGKLVPRHWVPGPASIPASAPAPDDEARRLVGLLRGLATFRHMQRTNLAFALGSRLRLGGHTLWEGVEAVVEEEVSPQHAYQWRLFEALLVALRDESERQHAKLVVVGIPYLPQVYDDIWKATFGGRPGFSQTAAIDRVRAFCEGHGIVYLDTRDAFRKKHAEVKRWLHYRFDAHPTAEGQAVIAKAIEDAGLIQPVER